MENMHNIFIIRTTTLCQRSLFFYTIFTEKVQFYSLGISRFKSEKNMRKDTQK